MRKSPCKNCQERRLGCHGECDKYIAYSKEREDMLENRQRYLNAHSHTVSYLNNVEKKIRGK